MPGSNETGWTWPIGARLETTVGIERQIVTAYVVARKRGWFGRERYRVVYGVYDADFRARYRETRWRSAKRLWAASASRSAS